jgi:RIP metalloprotease RseP
MGFLGVIAFILALLISVMIHEYGHYITAKRYGMRVTEFFVGFGKRLWSTQRGETEFGIKAIPAGGYCKISGMSPNEELADEFKARAFYLASAPKKLVVLGAGSFLHFVLALFLLFTLFAGIGTSQVLPTISQVLPCVPKESTNFSS